MTPPSNRLTHLLRIGLTSASITLTPASRNRPMKKQGEVSAFFFSNQSKQLQKAGLGLVHRASFIGLTHHSPVSTSFTCHLPASASFTCLFTCHQHHSSVINIIHPSQQNLNLVLTKPQPRLNKNLHSSWTVILLIDKKKTNPLLIIHVWLNLLPATSSLAFRFRFSSSFLIFVILERSHCRWVMGFCWNG